MLLSISHPPHLHVSHRSSLRQHFPNFTSLYEYKSSLNSPQIFTSLYLITSSTVPTFYFPIRHHLINSPQISISYCTSVFINIVHINIHQTCIFLVHHQQRTCTASHRSSLINMYLSSRAITHQILTAPNSQLTHVTYFP